MPIISLQSYFYILYNFLSQAQIFVGTFQQQRSRCQDRRSIFISPDTMILAIFDGHGQYDEAPIFLQKYFAQTLSQALTSQISNPNSVYKIISQVYNQLFDQYEKNYADLNSGSTIICYLEHMKHQFLINIGDSRAKGFIFSKQVDSNQKQSFLNICKHSEPKKEVSVSRQLSNDHSFRNNTEVFRATTAGGRFERNRLYPFPNDNEKSLAVTRSFGDCIVQNEAFIGIPDVYLLNSKNQNLDHTPQLIEIDYNFDMILLCSDGLYDNLPTNQIYSMIKQRIQLFLETGDFSYINPYTISRKLSKQAVIQNQGISKYDDDVTIIIYFKPNYINSIILEAQGLLDRPLSVEDYCTYIKVFQQSLQVRFQPLLSKSDVQLKLLKMLDFVKLDFKFKDYEIGSYLVLDEQWDKDKI